MKNTTRGSALLSALIFGAILLFALAALIGTALTEYRGSTRAALNSTSFFLAEAGIDRATRTALDDSFEAVGTLWTKQANGNYSRTFSADAASLGGVDGGYKVVVIKTVGGTETTFAIHARGWANNEGGRISTTRAVKATFARETESADGDGVGCLSRSSWKGGSTGDANIAADQIGATFDAYSSNFNGNDNTAPSVLNRTNKCVVGTESAEDNALSLVNGRFFCTVGTGSSTANPTPDVGFATANGVSLATIDKRDTAVDDQVLYDGTSNTEYLLRRDIDVDIPSIVPDAVTADNGWTIVMPGTGADNSQWRNAGKLTQYSDTDNSTAASPNVAYNSATSTLTLGATNTDKVYASTESMDNISRIEVSGEVILIVNGSINSNNLVVNYKTPDAKLKIYTNGQVSGVIGSTQQLNGAATPTKNWEADRLTINVLPSASNLSAKGAWDPVANKSVFPTTAAIATNAQTAVTAADESDDPTTGGSSLTMNFDDDDVFVGAVYAPYSYAQLSATGTARGLGANNKMSDYCGALIAGSLSVVGSNGFAFHFDQALGGGSDSNPKLTLRNWSQMAPTAAVFD